MAIPKLPPAAAAIRTDLLRAQGRAFQEGRLRAGLSQRAAAAAWDVGLDALRQWERGRRTIPAQYRARAVAEWGADPVALADTCPHCGHPFSIDQSGTPGADGT